ncbi:MAG: hypothetical protein ACP5OC_03395 [Thermoplasmata archaeon]
MNPLIVKVIIVGIIAVSGGVAGISAFTYYHASENSNNINQFIPANSTFVAQISTGSTSAIVFSANNSIGVSLSMSYSSFMGQLNNTSNSTVRQPLNISYVGTYDGFMIYKMNGLNLLSLLVNQLNLTTNLTTYANNLSLTSLLPSNYTTIYITPIGFNGVLLGMPAGVYAAIGAGYSGHRFAYDKYIDPHANLSFYFNGSTPILSTITANVTYSQSGNITLNAYVNFTSPVYESAFIASASLIFDQMNASFTYHAYNTLIEFTATFAGSGLTNLTQSMKIP